MFWWSKTYILFYFCAGIEIQIVHCTILLGKPKFKTNKKNQQNLKQCSCCWKDIWREKRYTKENYYFPETVILKEIIMCFCLTLFLKLANGRTCVRILFLKCAHAYWEDIWWGKSLFWLWMKGKYESQSYFVVLRFIYIRAKANAKAIFSLMFAATAVAVV